MNSKAPQVSIGLPVYNGEKFIERTLDSLLNQSFKDFEVIISNNASTDRTEQICKSYSAKDSRIRYYSNQSNLGGSWNYNRVLKLSNGKYFKWAAHDDVCHPEFIKKCVDVLDKDESIVLCFSRTKVIDENGNFLYSPESFLERADSYSVQERFHDILFYLVACDHLFGLIRTDVLKKTLGYGYYWTADKGLIAELSLWGRFYEINEELLLRRSHKDQVTEVSLDQKYQWINPQKRDKVPYQVRAALHYFYSIRRSRLSIQQKTHCLWLLLSKILMQNGIKAYINNHLQHS